MIYDIDGNLLSGGDSPSANQVHKHKNGVLNAVNVIKQFCNIDWTTAASGMPNASDSATIAQGTTVKGLPYSSASVEDGYIGIGISLYTFMSAVHNPRSVLYTEKSKGYTGYAYYGTVCTSLTCASWGLPCLVTTTALPKCSFVEQKTFASMEVGDVILKGGHVMMISGIKRDATGAITHVRTSESKYTHCVENAYQTYDAFVSSHSGYVPYRYKYIDSVESYVPYPTYPLMDDNEDDTVFPDIMTVFGDKVTRKKGTDIGITVLDSTGYSQIEVYHDGSLIDTKTSLADFTITAPDVGLYEVRMMGSGKKSSTFFDIVDCTASISGNDVTFATTYSATAVGGYPTYSTDSSGKATTWNNPKRVRLLTETENVGRAFDISDMRGDSDCTGGIRIYIKGAYGSVSFEYPY